MPSTAATSGGFWGAVAKTGDWIQTRINGIDIFDEKFQDQAKTNPWYALGPIFYYVWFITMFTGLVLIMWYIPSKAAAYDSILTIQTSIPFGNLMRGVHKYGADAMIIAATMRVFRIFILGDYKQGRELNIAIGLVMLLLSMYSGLTGYLLIWNQRAFWATKVFATFPTYMDQFPVMGDYYEPLVKSLHLGWNTAEVLLGAGGAITQETITRFFSLHLAFSLIPLILVEIYFYKNNYTRMPLNWIKRVIVALMVIITALILPAAQGRRSDPDVTPLPILSDWYFLGLYQMYKYLEPVVATEITMVIPVTVILLPFLENLISGPEKSILKRPFMLMTTIMGGLVWIVFSILIIVNIANIHNDPPYWRSIMYGMVDIGLIWQMVLIWQSKDAKEWAKGATPSIVMIIIAALQSALAFTFWFMAKTEMFLSPLTQGWFYWMVRPFMGENAEKVESMTRTLVPVGIEMPYNRDFSEAVSGWIVKIPSGQQTLDQLNALCASATTPIDWMFKLIPTFTPETHPEYHGLVDYLVVNKWAWDYVTWMDRMGWGAREIKPFPTEVHPVDWWWMVGGVVTMLFGIVTYIKCKQEAAKAPAAPPPKQPAAAAAAK